MKILDVILLIVSTLREMESEDHGPQAQGTPTSLHSYSDIHGAIRIYRLAARPVYSRSTCDGGRGAP